MGQRLDWAILGWVAAKKCDIDAVKWFIASGPGDRWDTDELVSFSIGRVWFELVSEWSVTAR